MNRIVSRMCFVCREIQPKYKMIRLAKTANNEIIIDKTGKAEGRGAYICLNQNCIEQIKKKKILNKAFKCEFPSDAYEKLCEELIDNKN